MTENIENVVVEITIENTLKGKVLKTYLANVKENVKLIDLIETETSEKNKVSFGKQISENKLENVNLLVDNFDIVLLPVYDLHVLKKLNDLILTSACTFENDVKAQIYTAFNELNNKVAFQIENPKIKKVSAVGTKVSYKYYMLLAILFSDKGLTFEQLQVQNNLLEDGGAIASLNQQFNKFQHEQKFVTDHKEKENSIFFDIKGTNLNKGSKISKTYTNKFGKSSVKTKINMQLTCNVPAFIETTYINWLIENTNLTAEKIDAYKVGLQS